MKNEAAILNKRERWEDRRGKDGNKGKEDSRKKQKAISEDERVEEEVGEKTVE